MSYDIVTVGNTLVDALMTFGPSQKSIRIHPHTEDLVLKMGEKFLADGCSFSMGGGAGRVAVALARLNYKTAVFAETGRDSLSEIIVSALKSAGVDTKYLIRSDKQTSFTVGINFKKERTLLINHVEYEHDFEFRGLKTRWFYLGSLGHKWEEVYKRVEKYAKRPEVFFAFNPGKTQFEKGTKSFSYLFASTDILFVNLEEAETIVGRRGEVSSTLKKLHDLGIKTAVITDGKKGSYCITQSGQMYYMSAYPTEVIEKTGAGDAYAAGFLAAIMADMTVQTAMSWGSLSAASVIGHVGGEKGLLRKDELLSMYEKGDMLSPVELKD